MVNPKVICKKTRKIHIRGCLACLAFLFSIMTQRVSCWPSVNCQFLLVSQMVLNDTLPSNISSCTPLLSHGGAAWPWRRLLAPPTSKSAAGALMEHFHLESWGSSLSTEQLNFTRGPEETLDRVLIPQGERCGCEGTREQAVCGKVA